MMAKKLQHFDFLLFISVCVLTFFGIVVIGSATHINAGASPSMVNNQIMWFVIGLIIMFIAAFFVNYSYISNFFILLYFINIFMLIAVLVFGTTLNNAKRWILIGPVSIQPSELSKLIMVFCTAKFIDKEREKINNIFILGALIALTFIPTYLIYKQPSLSASLVLISILISELFVAKISYKYIVPIVSITFITGTAIIWDITKEQPLFIDQILKTYQIKRILAILFPEDYPEIAYQTIKSMEAIGSGQFYGKGLYKGTLNQLSYLIEPSNDFIFSVIGEEFGFIGCIAVLACMLFIIAKCLLIAKKAPDFFSQLIVSGIAGMFAFQTFVNVGVTTGILPTTGMGLPFISSGGTSLVMNMMAIGLVFNIGMNKPKSLFEGSTAA